MNDSAEKIADRMTVILGLLGLLHDGAFGALSERQRGALTELLATSEELRQLLGHSSNGHAMLAKRSRESRP